MQTASNILVFIHYIYIWNNIQASFCFVLLVVLSYADGYCEHKMCRLQRGSDENYVSFWCIIWASVYIYFFIGNPQHIFRWSAHVQSPEPGVPFNCHLLWLTFTWSCSPRQFQLPLFCHLNTTFHQVGTSVIKEMPTSSMCVFFLEAVELALLSLELL